MNTAHTESLARINAYRAANGLDALKDFRPARHQEFLDKIVAPWEEMIAAEQAKKDAEAKAAAQVEKVKAPTYKEIATYTRSTVLNPVKMIHDFLDANPDLGRKAAVQALVAKGVNYSTARTQYQRWFAKRKG